MKKIIILILIIFMLVSCKKKEEEIVIPEDIKENVLEENIIEESIIEESNILDLTFMTDTILYAEIFNMTMDPESYLNKKIRIRGLFVTGEGLDGELIFGCLIPDATACCSQGMEFVLKDENIKYPDDYPNEGDEIIIEGDFYYETIDYYSVIRIVNATMETIIR